MPECEGISVIIPTYNRREELLRAVESARSQTRPPDEIIVVDDHSDFSVKDFLNERYGDTITVIRNSENLCASESRNVGIRHSSGGCIALLDSDDYWMPGKLEKQLAVMEVRAEVGLVYCDMWEEKENGIRRPSGYELFETNIFERCLEGWIPPNPSTLMFRRSTYDVVGGLPSSFTSNSDVDFFMRISLSHFEIACVQEPLSVFTMGGAGRNTFNPAIRFSSTETFLKKWEKQIVTLRGRKIYNQFRNMYWRKVAFPIVVFMIRNGRLGTATSAFLKYLAPNPHFYAHVWRRVVFRGERLVTSKRKLP